MTLPTDPYNFTNGSTADAEQVDARFAALFAALSAGGLDPSVFAAGTVPASKLEQAAWTASTPALTQPSAITKTVTLSRYYRVGRMIHWTFRLDVTGAGTAGQAVGVELPVPAASGNALVCGSGYIYDASVPYLYQATAILASTSVLNFFSGYTTTFTAFNGALANGDVISGMVTYEAAS